jgi:hypothetical protein
MAVDVMKQATFKGAVLLLLALQRPALPITATKVLIFGFITRALSEIVISRSAARALTYAKESTARLVSGNCCQRHCQRRRGLE